MLGGGGVVGGGDDVGGGGVVGVDQNSDFSLSNVQPFNPSDAQVVQPGLGRSAGEGRRREEDTCPVSWEG